MVRRLSILQLLRTSLADYFDEFASQSDFEERASAYESRVKEKNKNAWEKFLSRDE